MAFQWPPYIPTSAKRVGFTTLPHYVDCDVDVSSNQLKITFGTRWTAFVPFLAQDSNGTHYVHTMGGYDQYGYAYPMSRVNIYPTNGPQEYATSPSFLGRDGTNYTSANGVTEAGGLENLQYPNNFVDYDFSDSQSCIATWAGLSNTYLILGASGITGLYAIVDSNITQGRSARMRRVTADKYLIIWCSAQNTNILYRYCYFTLSTQTLSAVTAMPTMESSANVENGIELFDAGEGYYYVVYVVSGNLYIRGMDATGATPVLTALLGGSGTATFNGVAGALNPASGTGNGYRRYVTVGTDRVIAFMAGNRFVRITFTQAAKGTPTIVTGVRTSTGTGNQVYTEFDPTDTSQFYLVRWSSVPGNPTTFYGEYLSVLGSISSNFQGYQAIHSFYVGNYEFDVCGPFGGSAARGEGYFSFVGQYISDSDGTTDYPTSGTFAYSCWHTPMLYEVGVSVTSDYTSISIPGRIVTALRAVTIDSAYSSVAIGLALPSFAVDRFKWSLSVSVIYEYQVSITSTYTSVSLGGEIIHIVEALPLDQYWLNIGHTWMDDFMTYVNQDRFAVGLPRYKTWGEDGQYIKRLDIAQLHANNMAAYRIYQHNSTGLPAGQTTITERGDLMPAGGIAENLQLIPQYQLALHYVNPNYTPTGYVTAYDAWLGWHNSPPHYANIINNWGEKNGVVYSLLGAEEALCDPALFTTYPVLADWKVLYLCNNFVVLETTVYEIQIDQYWDNSGALISSLDQEWSNSAWTHVATRHESSYSLRVSSHAFEAVWGCRVSAEHSAPITYSAAAQHTSPYSAADPIAQNWTVFPYAVKDTTTVVAGHEAEFALRVAATFESPYSMMVRLAASNEAGYQIKNTTPVATQHNAGFSLSVAAQHSGDYSLMSAVARQYEAGYAVVNTEPVTKQHEVGYGMSVSTQSAATWTLHTKVSAQNELSYGEVVPVRSQAQLDYALLQNNPIAVSMEHYYALEEYASQLAANNVVTLVLASGQTLRIDDGVIDSANGEVGYGFECSIPDIATFSSVQEDDLIVVNFCGELYNFIVKSKSMRRDGPEKVTMRIAADNAVVRTGQPYAQETDFIQETDIMASALVDSLIEIDFNYELVDWTILSGRLQVSGATSLEAVTQIAEATGGVVDGTPEGEMWLRYPYPYAMNALASAPVGQSYSDSYDNLSVSISTEYRDGADRFRIREGDSAFADALEWILDEPQTDPIYQTGVLKAYLSPYRTTATITHLGNAAYVTMLGEEIEENEELIEFNKGVGNTRRPVESILSVEWYTASLGSPAFTPFSTLLNVGQTVNGGYGLAKVRYNAKHLTARAGGVPAAVESGEVGPASSYAYFILEEANG